MQPTPMIMILTHLAAFIAGAAIGIAFFAGLWVTLAGLHRASHPAARILGSLLLRLALVLCGFYVIAYFGQWTHLVVATVGFTAARPLMVRRVLRHQDAARP